jgi:hypothetical protein
MISNKDLAKLAAVLATKEDIKDIHESLDSLNESTRALTTIADNLAKTTNNLKQDHIAFVGIIDRHEKWIKQLAKTTGQNLEA